MPSTPFNADAIENLDTHGLTADTHKVALVSALAWSYRTPADLHRLLGRCALKTTARKTFTAGYLHFSSSKNLQGALPEPSGRLEKDKEVFRRSCTPAHAPPRLCQPYASIVR